MRRLGVFGGSFDPIHYGHLAVAEAVRVDFALDQVLFVPAAQQPLKASHHTSAADRRAMVAAAIADNPNFVLCELELERAGPSYTVDTLLSLHQLEPTAQFWFVLGADALSSLPRWHLIEQLAQLTRFLVVQRPGASIDVAAATAGVAALHGRIDVCAAPALDISATELRQRVEQGRSVRYLLPDPVHAYIVTHHLYQPMQGQPAQADL